MSAATNKLKKESHNLLSRTKLFFEYQEDNVMHDLLKRRVSAKKRARNANR